MANRTLFSCLKFRSTCPISSNACAELYELQKHVVITIAAKGSSTPTDMNWVRNHPATTLLANVSYSGAAESLKQMLCTALGDAYFQVSKRHDDAKSAIFTRKIGHTQRGGRPIKFDRFFRHPKSAAKRSIWSSANKIIPVATLNWSHENGFFLDSLAANKLSDQWGMIHPRTVHPSLYDAHRFQPSKLGIQYLLSIFTNAIGADDVECIRSDLFSPGNLSSRYQSVNIDIQKRMKFLSTD